MACMFLKALSCSKGDIYIFFNERGSQVLNVLSGRLLFHGIKLILSQYISQALFKK